MPIHLYKSAFYSGIAILVLLYGLIMWIFFIFTSKFTKYRCFDFLSDTININKPNGLVRLRYTCRWVIILKNDFKIFFSLIYMKLKENKLIFTTLNSHCIINLIYMYLLYHIDGCVHMYCIIYLHQNLIVLLYSVLGRKPDSKELYTVITLWKSSSNNHKTLSKR